MTFGNSRKAVSLIATIAIVLAMAPVALADTATFTLNIGNTQLSGASAGPYATVNLVLNGDGTITVTVSGAAGMGLFGPGGAFGANPTVNDWVLLSVSNPAFSLGSAGQLDGAGFFSFVLDGPQGVNNVDSFSFTVGRLNGTFSTVAEFGNFFGAHIYPRDNPTMTGFAWNGDPIPEPGTLALLGSGLIALGGILRRRLKT